MLRIHNSTTRRKKALALFLLVFNLTIHVLPAQTSVDTSFKSLMTNLIGQCTFMSVGDTSFLFSLRNTGHCEQKDTNTVYVFYSKVSDSLYLGNVINLFDSSRLREYQKTGCSSFFAFPLDGIVALCTSNFDGQRKYRTEKEGATMFRSIRMYDREKNLMRSVRPFYLNTSKGIELSFACFKKKSDDYYEQGCFLKFSEILTHKKLMTSDRDLLEIVKFSKDFIRYYAEAWEKTEIRFETYDNIILRKN